jgi:hypothetical protein
MEYRLPVQLVGEPARFAWKYFELRGNGQSKNMAIIFAFQQAPGIVTDSTYFHGSRMLGDVWGEQQAGELVQEAAKHGYTVGANDNYNPTRARFKGDPLAFTKHGEGRTKVREVCELRGIDAPEYGIKSSDKNKGKALNKARDVAPDIVRNEIRLALKDGDVRKPKNMVEDAVSSLTLRKKKRK